MKDEGALFTQNLKAEKDVNQWLNSSFRNSEPIISTLSKENESISNIQERGSRIMSDGAFLCNIPPVLKAYSSKSWLFQYTRGFAYHGMDIRAFFYDPDKSDSLLGLASLPGALSMFVDRDLKTFAPTMQSYIASYALIGDPNTMVAKSAKFPAVNWSKVMRKDSSYSNVMDAGNGGYSVIESKLVSHDLCQKWLKVLRVVQQDSAV
jgi:carboxylesterase type B